MLTFSHLVDKQQTVGLSELFHCKQQPIAAVNEIDDSGVCGPEDKNKYFNEAKMLCIAEWGC